MSEKPKVLDPNIAAYQYLHDWLDRFSHIEKVQMTGTMIQKTVKTAEAIYDGRIKIKDES